MTRRKPTRGNTARPTLAVAVALRRWPALLRVSTYLAVGLFATFGAAASVDSELAYHRGVAAMGADELAEAREQLLIALEADPEDASVLQALGIIASRQGDAKRAIEYLKRAVAAGPDDPEIHFLLGVALLHRDRADEAALEFDQVLAVDPQNARAQFYAGVSDYRRQRYPETVEHMQSALELDAALRLRARYYIGLAEVFTGNLDASAAAFADAASLSPSDPLSISADRLGKTIQPESRRWGLDASTGVEFDSNPTFVGSNVVFLDEDGDLVEPDREEDVLAVFAIDSYYELIRRERTNLRLGYSGFLSVHDRAEQVDQLTHLLWTDLSLSQEKLRFGVRFDFSTTDLDLDRDYQEMFRLSPSLTYTHGRWGVTQVLYQFYDLNYRFSTEGQGDFDPDGELHDIGLSQFVYLPAPFTFARVGLGYEHAKTDGTEFDYDGVEVNAGVGLALPHAIHMGLLVQYVHRDYKHETRVEGSDPGGGPKREDDVATIKLDFSVPLAEYWEFALRGAFTFNDSNIEDYDYNRHVVGSHFTFTF